MNQLPFCETHWILRDDYVGSLFFDGTASAFIMPNLQKRMQQSAVSCSAETPGVGYMHSPTIQSAPLGYGLGPNWASRSSFRETFVSSQLSPSQLHVISS
jgi:hypothetical protein